MYILFKLTLLLLSPLASLPYFTQLTAYALEKKHTKKIKIEKLVGYIDIIFI